MIELKNISLSYQRLQQSPKVIFKNLNLSLNEGSFCTVIGTNGAGKSTLMQLLTGQAKPNIGEIYVNGFCVNQLPEHKRADVIGRVFQDPLKGSAGNLSVFENLCLAYRKGRRQLLSFYYNKSFYSEMQDKLSDFQLGLENCLDLPMGVLSGGQRQVVSLVMASINEPKVLLLDEHTSALDPKTADLVMYHTKRLIERSNLTTLMITHNMEHAVKYGNRLIILNEGRIQKDFNEFQKRQLNADQLLLMFAKMSQGGGEENVRYENSNYVISDHGKVVGI